jgi:hypothetical protein
MQRRKFTFISSFTVGLFAIAVTGCGASAPGPTDITPNAETEGSSAETSTEDGSSSSSSGGGEAVFTYGDTIYTSDLQLCILSEEDAVFHGAAYDESGSAVGYLGGDFGILDGGNAFGDARIDFGATENLEMSDDFIMLGDSASHFALTAFSDTNWNILGSARNQDGTLTGSSSLRISCGE